jgi:hypothetical protein
LGDFADTKTVKRLIKIILALAIGGAAGATAIIVIGDSAPASDSPPAVRFHYANMEDAGESAFREAAEWYGLPAPDSYIRDENEGARCPSHVPAMKGRVFWCQALLEGKLVPVEVELTSPLGFFKVVKIGENMALWEQLEGEEAEEQWCWSHPYSPAC